MKLGVHDGAKVAPNPYPSLPHRSEVHTELETPQTLILKTPAGSRTSSMLIFKLTFIPWVPEIWGWIEFTIHHPEAFRMNLPTGRAKVISSRASSNIYFLQKHSLLGNVLYLFVLVLERLSGTQETYSKASI